MRSFVRTAGARRLSLTTGAAVIALSATATLGGGAAAVAAMVDAVAPTAATGLGNSSGTHTLTVESGQTAVVTETTTLTSLTIEEGAALVAPEGFALSLTVNGIETGQQVASTGATESTVHPGVYRGDIVLTVAAENPIVFNGLTYDFRQALYVDANGVDSSKSVLSSVSGVAGDTAATGLGITSTGELFNGIYVVDADYTLVNPRISLTGNGRSDFAGQGAGIIGSGAETLLVIDGAKIDNTGVVRPAIVAKDGANVVVKNSTITTADGTLPGGYQSSVNLSYMQDAPWMLGIAGNNRATNLLGENTQATYISSSITSENWGALSVDTGSDTKLSAINSTVANSGEDGYGSYVIGNATERFLGTTFDVATYASIVTGGSVVYGDSTKDAVAALNSELELGLSATELAQLPVESTTITSDRFGVMWHNRGTVDISGGTTIATDETLFLDKGQQIGVTVDGSEGATLDAGNGVLLQVMDNDDPGPVPPLLLNTGVYTEPTNPVTKNTSFDVTTQHGTDAVTTFTDIALTGDFFNGMRGDIGGFGPAQPRNLVVNLDGSALTGVVTASTTKHRIDTITSAEYRELGVVTNTASEVVNNGVIVSLTGDSTWTVTGTSYLSSLTVEAGSTLAGSNGEAPVLTVDGVVTPLVAGTTYTGNVVITLG